MLADLPFVGEELDQSHPPIRIEGLSDQNDVRQRGEHRAADRPRDPHEGRDVRQRVKIVDVGDGSVVFANPVTARRRWIKLYAIRLNQRDHDRFGLLDQVVVDDIDDDLR